MTHLNPFPVVLSASSLHSFVEVPLRKGGTAQQTPFYSIELQRLEFGAPDGLGQPTSGLCARVEHWDRRVDLYPEHHLPVDANWVRTDPAYANLSVASINPTELDAELDVRGDRAVARLEFETASANTVRMDVSQTGARPSKPIFIPGEPQKGEPSTWRFMYLDHFWTLPKRHSSVAVSLDGEALTPATLILPDRVASHWSARAGCDLILCGVNGRGVSSSSQRVGDSARWFEALTQSRASATATASGEFTIDCPLGTVGTGQWHAEERSDGSSDLVLKDLSQDWSGGPTRPAVAGLRILRKIKRRNEQWSWAGTFSPHRAPESRLEGQWSVRSEGI